MTTIRKLALAMVILVVGASCTADGSPPATSLPDGVLPPAILGMAPPLSGQSISYYAGDEAAVGYLAVPEGEGPFPALIIIHEWNGLVDRVREVADAMADEGYVTLAADLYSGQVGTTGAENRALMSEHLADPDAMVANLDAAARFLRERDDVTGRVGAMGWCFGGGVALTYALGGEAHEATAIFYGSLVTDPEVLREVDAIYLNGPRTLAHAQLLRSRGALNLRIDRDFMSTLKPHCVILDPMQRSGDFDIEVQDPRLAFYRQAENALFARMALLSQMLLT